VTARWHTRDATLAEGMRDSAGAAFLPELEGLRGAAAWSIVVYHCFVFSSAATLRWTLGPATVFVPPLQSGVTLFFVLSGFLLYRPFAIALATGAPLPSTRRYLRNRALRILPAYWFVLIVSGLVLRSAVVASQTGGNAVGALDDPHTLVLDLLLLQNYDPTAIYTGILPSWSLCIEAAFYLCLPILVAAVGLTARRARLAVGPSAISFVAPAFLFAVAVAARLLVALEAPTTHVLAPSWAAVAARSLPANADLFAAGMAAAAIYEIWRRDGAPGWVTGGAAGRALAYVGLPAFVLGLYLIPRPLYDPLVAVLGALAVLRLLAPRTRGPSSPAGRGLLASRPARAAGRTSYGVFLWHYPILSLLATHHLLSGAHTAGGFLVNLLVVVPIVVLVSAATYRFVERPALRLKKSVRPQLARATA
jgi:peptidoglycan/LPS O-acetylase OafA/YrhL